MGISFKPYERVVELNTSQARTNVNITPTAYGVDQSGMSNLNKAIGTVASNIQQMEEEKLAIEVTDATNQYNMKVNDVLHNPENGLFNLEGKNAEGALSAFQVKEKEFIQFYANCPHKYECLSPQMASVIMKISYDRHKTSIT